MLQTHEWILQPRKQNTSRFCDCLRSYSLRYLPTAFNYIMLKIRPYDSFLVLLVMQIYGAVTMNNVLCLSVFLALVYVRGLTWDFSSEVLVILIVCIVMGLFGSFRTTFPLWTSSVAFLLYPFSLALVYVLDYFFGWS